MKKNDTKHWNFSQPCSPILKQVVWLSSTGTCPLFYPVPPNLKTHLFQFHHVPPNMETPLSVVHLFHVLQPVPIYSIWLYLPSFCKSLFSDFWVLHSHCTFQKNTFNWNVFSKYYFVGEGNQKVNSNKKTADNRDHRPKHMGVFCLKFNSSILWHQHTKEALLESTPHCV